MSEERDAADAHASATPEERAAAAAALHSLTKGLRAWLDEADDFCARMRGDR